MSLVVHSFDARQLPAAKGRDSRGVRRAKELQEQLDLIQQIEENLKKPRSAFKKRKRIFFRKADR